MSMHEPSTPAWMQEQLDAHVATATATAALLPAADLLARTICASLAAGGVLYTFGNGGSAADAQHFTGELIGHYKRDRRPLAAVTLSTDPTTMTCIANDYAFEDVFARQVEALARPGDVVAAFTTSGDSPNVVAGLAAARRSGATTAVFTGRDGGASLPLADHALVVPSALTPRIQELRMFLLHVVSEHIDLWAAA